MTFREPLDRITRELLGFVNCKSGAGLVNSSEQSHWLTQQLNGPARGTDVGEARGGEDWIMMTACRVFFVVMR